MPTLININTLNETLNNLACKAGTQKAAFLSALRAHFPDQKSLNSEQPITVEQLIKEIWNETEPSAIKKRRKSISSLKSALNRELKKLSKEDKNPEGIIVGRNNIFSISDERKTSLLQKLSGSLNSSKGIDEALNSLEQLLPKLQDEKTNLDLNKLLDSLKEAKQTIDHLSQELSEKNQRLDNLEGLLTSQDTGENDADGKDRGNNEVEEIEVQDENLGIVNDELIDDDENKNDDDIEKIDDDSEIINEEPIDDDENKNDDDFEKIDDDFEIVNEEQIDDDENKNDNDSEETDDDFEIVNEEPIDDDENKNDNDSEETDDDFEIVNEEPIDDDENKNDDDFEKIDDDSEIVNEEQIDDDENKNDDQLEKIDDDFEIVNNNTAADGGDSGREEEAPRKKLLEVLSKYMEPEEAESKEMLIESEEGLVAQLLARFTPRFIKIAAGIYNLGTDVPSRSEHSLEQRHLNTFYMGQYPVTNDIFELFVRETGYKTEAEIIGHSQVYRARCVSSINPATGRQIISISRGGGGSQVEGADWRHPEGRGSSIVNRGNHPVVQVSRRDATAFAAWAGKRLPNEAEWEAAARGINSRQPFPWGQSWGPELANTASSYLGATTPVDAHPGAVSPTGIHDLLGNVYEWTSPIEPATGSKIRYILKGGCWNSNHIISISHRLIAQSGASNTIGFRCLTGSQERKT